MRHETATIALLGSVVFASMPLGAQRGVPRGSSGCVLSSAGSERLLVQGRRAYVEPTVLSVAGDYALIAGTPNYLWSTVGSQMEVTARDSVFGAVMLPGGEWRFVPSPIEGRPFAQPRVLSRGNGHWDVVFAELESRADPGREVPLRRLWHARLSPEGWAEKTPIPLPESGRLRYEFASGIVAVGDSMMVAVPVETSRGQHDIVVLHPGSNGWRHELIEDGRVSEVALLPERAAEVRMLATSVDPDSPDTRRNSLFWYAHDSVWSKRDLLIAGRAAPVFGPVGMLGKQESWISFMLPIRESVSKRWEARVLQMDSLWRPRASSTLLDSSVLYRPAAVLLQDRPFWVLQHEQAASQPPQLRVVSVVEGRAVRLASAPTPFAGPHAAAAMRNELLLIAGPELDRERRALWTLLTRYILECPSP